MFCSKTVLMLHYRIDITSWVFVIFGELELKRQIFHLDKTIPPDL